jgi:hypothetical protein
MTANDALERIREWASEIELLEDATLVSIDALYEEIFRLERIENSKMTDKIVLSLVSSYLRHVINPQPSMDLSDLATLHPSDLLNYEIPKELFSVIEYSNTDVEHLADLLSEVIRKMEDRKIENI